MLPHGQRLPVVSKGMFYRMITCIDNLLDRVTMYRLVLYVLIGLIVIALVLSYFQLLPFSPFSLLLSTAFLVLICWAANSLLARIFAVPTNTESAYITALILALIIDPIQSATDLQFLGWAALLATSSKYILALRNKHLFNRCIHVLLPRVIRTKQHALSDMRCRKQRQDIFRLGRA
jgi:Na+-transporting NADH:ubiquinone oxidoreductase subunit NqrB